MPHRRRSLLRGPLGYAPTALLVILACSSERKNERSDSAVPRDTVAAADPAADLDRQFQLARSALNSEAAVLAGMDRASSEYATRYEAHLRNAASAESLRARRDSVRNAAAPAIPARPQ